MKCKAIRLVCSVLIHIHTYQHMDKEWMKRKIAKYKSRTEKQRDAHRDRERENEANKKPNAIFILVTSRLTCIFKL